MLDIGTITLRGGQLAAIYREAGLGQQKLSSGDRFCGKPHRTRANSLGIGRGERSSARIQNVPRMRTKRERTVPPGQNRCVVRQGAVLQFLLSRRGRIGCRRGNLGGKVVAADDRPRRRQACVPGPSVRKTDHRSRLGLPVFGDLGTLFASAPGCHRQRIAEASPPRPARMESPPVPANFCLRPARCVLDFAGSRSHRLDQCLAGTNECRLSRPSTLPVAVFRLPVFGGLLLGGGDVDQPDLLAAVGRDASDDDRGRGLGSQPTHARRAGGLGARPQATALEDGRPSLVALGHPSCAPPDLIAPSASSSSSLKPKPQAFRVHASSLHRVGAAKSEKSSPSV